MKIKTSELTGAALDWAVEIPQGFRRYDSICVQDNGKVETRLMIADGSCAMRLPRHYSTNWAQGGPIIEREEISIKHVVPAMKGSIWQAYPSMSAKGAGGKWGIGSTPLIAAMRCYVASKLGEEVEIPDELR